MQAVLCVLLIIGTSASGNVENEAGKINMFGVFDDLRQIVPFGMT